MRLWLGTVLVCGLLIELGSPARALVIDDDIDGGTHTSFWVVCADQP